jgi:low affinity Fe/Cu permease
MKAWAFVGIVASVFLLAIGILLIYAAGVVISSEYGPIFSWELAIPGIIMICIGVAVLVWLCVAGLRMLPRQENEGV